MRTRQPLQPQSFDSDNNPLFILIPRQDTDHPRVVDFVVRQGRVNEPFAGSVIFPSIPRPALRLKYKDNDLNGEPDTLEAIFHKLTMFIAPESKEYAMTEQGRAEIQKLADCIFKYKDKPVMRAE